MDIYTLAIFLSIVVYIGLGNYAGKGIVKLDEYYVAGRRSPTLLIVGTLVASMLSTNAFLGETGFAYDGQAGPYIIWPPTVSLGFVWGALFFGRYLRRSRALTVADYFGQRFNSHRVQQAAGITIVLALGGYLLSVTMGAAVLLSELTGLGYNAALILAWASYTAFTLYSGSRGVVLTDTIMFLLFTLASFAALFVLLQGFGGWPEIANQLVGLREKPDLLSWHGMVGPGTEWPTPLDFLIWLVILDVSWSVVAAVSPWQSSRHLMARDEHVVIRAACVACLVAMILQVVLYMAGVTINLAKADISPSENVMIWGAKNLLPPALGALLLAGIMAAALSSASTFLSLVGFSANNDLVRHTRTGEKDRLRLSRYTMLGIGLVTLVLGLFNPPNIFWLVYFVGTVFASSWGVVALMSVWSRRITAAAAFWGIISGFVFNVGPKALEFFGWVSWPSWANPILIGGLVSLVVTVTVSLNTRVTPEEEQYRQRLHQTPEPERNRRKTRVTQYGPALMVLAGVVVPLMYAHWHIGPYQAAAGRLDADGSINWLTGEGILVLMWAAWLIPSGLFTAWWIRRSYSPG